MNKISIMMHDDTPLHDQIQDQIITLFHRESVYISSSTTTTNHPPPLRHIHNRGRILKWFYTVVAHFQYDRDVIPISMDYIDRFLVSNSSTKDISSRLYKLIAMTSLYLAIKLHVSDDPQQKRICLQEYACLSKGLISPKDICSMERCILDTIDWRVHPVSPMCFVRYFFRLMEPIRRNEVPNVQSGKIAPEDENYECQSMDLCMKVLSNIALYFTELAICMPETTAYFQLDKDKDCSMDSRSFAPSTIAYASIILSMEMVSYSALPLVIRELFLRKCKELSIHNHYSLHPDRRDVQELQIRIEKSFTLDKHLNRVAAHGGRANRCISEIYPIKKAIRCGILNSRFFEGISISRAIDFKDSDLSPTSSLSRGISTSIPFNRITFRTGPHISISTAKRKPITCEDYHFSPTSSTDQDISSCDLPPRKRIK